MLDVSLEIAPDLLVWPGDPAIEIVPRVQIAKGDAANVSELRIGTHTGTHVDPPVHFIEGAAGIDQVSLDALAGPCVVADLRDYVGRYGRLKLTREDGRLLLHADQPVLMVEILHNRNVQKFVKRSGTLSFSIHPVWVCGMTPLSTCCTWLRAESYTCLAIRLH